MIRKARIVFCASSQDYFDFFERAVQMPTSSMLCATLLIAQEYMENKMTKKMRMQPSHEALLTPGQKGRLADHRALIQGDAELRGNFVADIAGTSSMRKAQLFVPTLVQNSMMWFEAAGRKALPTENLVFQGGPAILGLAPPEFQCSWVELIGVLGGEGISDSDCRSLAGVAMHATVIGSLFLFAMLHIEFRDTSLRFHRMQSAASGFLADDEEQDVDIE